ncbi:hypothetical protein MIR68_010050 [Amoeboaphelidium protococcarum]|nr:hypothetical protein MIR68_010050 [Amoeboaphelidium protococcarum]
MNVPTISVEDVDAGIMKDISNVADNQHLVQEWSLIQPGLLHKIALGYSVIAELPVVFKNQSLSVVHLMKRYTSDRVLGMINGNLLRLQHSLSDFVSDRVLGDENYVPSFYIDTQHCVFGETAITIDRSYQNDAVPYANMTQQQLLSYRYKFLAYKERKYLIKQVGHNSDPNSCNVSKDRDKQLKSSIETFNPPQSWSLSFSIVIAAIRGLLHHDVSLNAVRVLSNFTYPFVPRNVLIQKLSLPDGKFAKNQLFDGHLQQFDLSGVQSIRRLDWVSPLAREQQQSDMDTHLDVQYQYHMHLSRADKLRQLTRARFSIHPHGEGHHSHIGGEWISHPAVVKQAKQRMMNKYGDQVVTAAENFIAGLNAVVLEWQSLTRSTSIFPYSERSQKSILWSSDHFRCWMIAFNAEDSVKSQPKNGLVPSFSTELISLKDQSLLKHKRSLTADYKLTKARRQMLMALRQLQSAQKQFKSDKPLNYLTRLADCEYSEDKVVLYIHGGGYCIMSSETHRSLTWKISRDTGCRVLAVDYRRTPEFVFPAALIDCTSSYVHLLQGNYVDQLSMAYFEMFELDPDFPHPAVLSGKSVDLSQDKKIRAENIVIMGDSAGGGLSLSLLLHLRDLGVPMPAASVLISPWVELTCSLPSWARNHEYDYIPQLHIMDTENIMSHFVGWYRHNHNYKQSTSGDDCGGDEDVVKRKLKTGESLLSCESGLVSGVYGDVGHGLGRILIQCGEKEYLLDESLLLYHKISAGCDSSAASSTTSTKQVRLEVYQDMVHVWHFFEWLHQADVAFKRIGQFVHECFGYQVSSSQELQPGTDTNIEVETQTFEQSVDTRRDSVSQFESTTAAEGEQFSPSHCIKDTTTTAGMLCEKLYVRSDGTVCNINGDLKIGSKFYQESNVSMK